MARPPLDELASGTALYQRIGKAEAVRNKIPFAIVDAVMRVESGYDPRARGDVGEVGLMQILPATADMMGFKGPLASLSEPATNIAYGTQYLAEAWRLANQDICTTVMKYRAGHAETRFSVKSVDYCKRVRRHLASIGYPVTGEVPKPTFGFREGGGVDPRQGTRPGQARRRQMLRQGRTAGAQFRRLHLARTCSSRRDC